MRWLTLLLLLPGVALAAAGCGGGGKRQMFAARDLPRILATQPPQGDYGSEPEERGVAKSGADLFIRGVGPPADETSLFKTLEAAGLLSGYRVMWSDVGMGVGLVFQSAKRAHTALDAIRSFRRRFSQEFKDRVEKDVPAPGLGEESWGVKGLYRDGGELEAAEYGWRRGNLVLWAEFDWPEGCECPIVRETRAYADALDEQAQKG